ncbi:DUF188 domain-containing protein [Heliorestis acidaminivorans]|uniref:UPF0178 protein F9B85_00920 n=1 Tax=Heliorestis acidaminivorans TaxID=553427 RepID=A0A6I0F4I8_9FIRM|nr:DUF188 domain-containing protein [Heliorestis acidaminivorans]KAB2954670.1 DUF188 domain-containing protein [Heliorestis acidaminivorans]
MKIVVDADACPKGVLQASIKVAKEYKVALWTIASFNHHIQSDHHITVGNASQEADLKILNVTQEGDIVVTQDWGLAAMILGKKGRCISPGGREFQADKIEFLLEERDMKAKFRRSGGRTRGMKKRTKEDDLSFERQLRRILQESSECKHQ